MLSDFAKDKVFWTKKMNLKLVKFIQNRPNIWNPKHPKYTSMEYRDQTYADFALKYGNEFTGQAVKHRWTNIRSTFANYLRKVKASRKAGEEYKVNWHLWDSCQFLLNINKKNTPTSCGSEYVDEDKQESNLPPLGLKWNSSEDMTDNKSICISDSCQNIAECLLTVFKGVQCDAFGIENTNHDNIGRAVSEKMCQLSSLEAAQLTHKITEILLLYNEDNPRNPNNT